MQDGIMQRELIKWLQTLDLSHPVRHPHQDLSNGFTLAEIASRYDRRVCMHSYVPGCSTECKRRNWKVLLRDLRRLGCNGVTAEMAEATIQGRPGAASVVLDHFYEFFCNRPPPSRTNEKNDNKKLSVKNALDVVRTGKGDSVVLGMEQKLMPLRVIENDEIAFGSGIKQPGFARPTAASLLHVANRDTRNALLVAAVPPDELLLQKRNETLLSEHEILHKAYRYAEPKRFAPVKQKRAAGSQKGKKRKSLHGGGSQWEHSVSADHTSVVEVNMLNKRLLGALQLRDSMENCNETVNRDEAQEESTRKIFEACDNNLRLGLSRLLGITLESQGLMGFLGDLTFEGGSPDTLTAFINHREGMSFAAVVMCWSTLLNANQAIASVLLGRPTEYMYILRALHFIFTSDMVQIPLLHVSASPEIHGSQRTSSDVAPALTQGGGGAVAYFSQGTNSMNSVPSPAEDVDEPQQAVFANERVYNVASAFSFLCSIGESVHAASPQLAYSLLIKYFIPTVSRFFSAASPAILEAIACVVVSHICGNGSNIQQEEEKEESAVNPNKKSGEQSTSGMSVEKQEWNATEKLTSFLAGPLRKAFLEDGTTNSMNSASRRIQYKLFLFHVLSHARVLLDADGMENEAGQGSTSTLQQEETSVAIMKTLPCCSPRSPVELCVNDILTTIGSSSMHERSIGLAMLIHILAWDRWDLVIDPLLFVLNDVKERGTSGSFLQRAAEAWEMRVLLLELLTITFRKALYIIAEDSANDFDDDKATSPSGVSCSTPDTRTAKTTMLSIIREKIDFALLEEVTVLCLDIFFNAPLLQRQLALQIVGSRLLPDEQRNVAAVWLRGLFVFSLDQLDFLLRPHEMEPLHMQDPTTSTQCLTQGNPQRSYGIMGVDFDEDKGSEVSSSPKPHLVSEKSSKEALSSVRVLLGRVEAAYVVAPLNQSWDTFSVVQATLMFEDVLSTAQVFSVILAAVLSPQRREAQRMRLLQNLRAVGIGGGGATSKYLPRAGEEDDNNVAAEKNKKMPLATTSDAGEDGNDKTLNVTLRNLVMSYGNGGSVKDEIAEKETVGEDVAATTKSENSSRGCSPNDAASTETGAKKESKATEEQEVETATTALESHEKAFWISVLRLLRPQLQECLTNESIHQEPQKRDGSFTVESTPTSAGPCNCVTRIGKNDSPARLKELAKAVLLTLYHRYGDDSSEVSPKEASLSKACRWLADM